MGGKLRKRIASTKEQIKKDITRYMEKKITKTLIRKHKARICRVCGERYDTEPPEDWSFGKDPFHLSCLKETGEEVHEATAVEYRDRGREIALPKVLRRETYKKGG